MTYCFPDLWLSRGSWSANPGNGQLGEMESWTGTIWIVQDLPICDQEAAEILASWREEEITIPEPSRSEREEGQTLSGNLVEGTLEGSKHQSSPVPRVPSGPTLG